MEGWRDWSSKDKEKKELRGPLDISDDAFPPALLVHVSGGEHQLILYKPKIKYNTDPVEFDRARVLGMVMIDKTNLDCIPNTMQIRFTAVAEKGKGYGSLIYGLTFHYANNKLGAGLTSDHNHSSSDDAKKMWNKLTNTKDLVMKKTRGNHPTGGHDTFDYSGENTPEDKKDDCDDGSDGDINNLATNHSWIMKGNKFKKSFEELTARNREYVKDASDAGEFIEDLIIKAAGVFRDKYGEEE
tara:strand:- start:2776 stop:3501 length:726 start_codon:yes stop_codon:yes gene_type:complete